PGRPRAHRRAGVVDSAASDAAGAPGGDRKAPPVRPADGVRAAGPNPLLRPAPEPRDTDGGGAAPRALAAAVDPRAAALRAGPCGPRGPGGRAPPGRPSRPARLGLAQPPHAAAGRRRWRCRPRAPVRGWRTGSARAAATGG